MGIDFDKTDKAVITIYEKEWPQQFLKIKSNF